MALELVRTDDLDKTDDNVQPVVLGWRGRAYKLDLGANNRGEIDTFLDPFIAAATDIGELPKPPADQLPEAAAPAARRPRRGGKTADTTAATPASTEVTSSNGKGLDAPATAREMRDWLVANGHNVSAKGALPKTAVEAYRAAHAS